MPARDRFHEAVKNALIKDGWRITDDPLSIRFGGIDLHIDLGAEKIIAAEKNGTKIAVEIKSFTHPSIIYEFHRALGEFLNYRIALADQDPERTLYLAVPEDTHKEFFTLHFTRTVVETYAVKLLVYEPRSEVIVQWIA
jgi:hypothetical protein